MLIAALVAVVLVGVRAARALDRAVPIRPTSASFNLIDAELPPSFTADGDPRFLLGTDNQGRDLLSAMLYGARVSIAIGGGAVLVAATRRRRCSACSPAISAAGSTRSSCAIGDVILSFPTILLALLVSGIARARLPRRRHGADWAPVILIGAIAIHEWVQYARTVRAATMVEAREGLCAARPRSSACRSRRIMLRHILPNVMSPVLVIATINLAAAVLTEATLSFLGVGMPPTYPSLGTLIRIGNEFVFSGIWWIALFPAADPGASSCWP